MPPWPGVLAPVAGPSQGNRGVRDSLLNVSGKGEAPTMYKAGGHLHHGGVGREPGGRALARGRARHRRRLAGSAVSLIAWAAGLGAADRDREARGARVSGGVAQRPSWWPAATPSRASRSRMGRNPGTRLLARRAACRLPHHPAGVVAEELTFRGVLWGLLRRDRGARAATVLSSVLFGLWHVPAALGGGGRMRPLVGHWRSSMAT